MNHRVNRRNFLKGTAALAMPGFTGSSADAAQSGTAKPAKRSLVVDNHAHVFPDQRGAVGYDDPTTHTRRLQAGVSTIWGRFVSSHTDPKYIPEPGEDVGFTMDKYNIWRWRKHGEDVWLRRGAESMIDPVHDPEQMLAHMNFVGVDMAVIQTGYVNAVWGREVYFLDCIRRWPDRFIGAADIDYDLAKSDKHLGTELETLARAVEELGYRGLYSHIPRGQPVDDPRCDPLWKECARLKIPVFLNTGFSPKADYLREIQRLESVSRRFPELKITSNHMGSNVLHPSDPNHVDNPTEFFGLFKLGNFHLEVGYVLAWENEAVWGWDAEYPYPRHKELIRRIYEEFGAGVMVWGADLPWLLRSCTYKQCFDSVRLHTEFMTDDDRGLVLGGNAARIYGVSPKGKRRVACISALNTGLVRPRGHD